MSRQTEPVVSFPIPLRVLFAAHPELLSPLLRIVHRVVARLMKLLTRKGDLIKEHEAALVGYPRCAGLGGLDRLRFRGNGSIRQPGSLSL
jgi:hypothetical protein